MMCEECGVRPAKFHLTTIAGEQKRERRLCEVCMAKYQKQLPGIDFANLAGFLSGFLQNNGGAPSEKIDEEFALLACTNCGTTYSTFQKSGKLGCAQCYKVFQKPLETLLMRIHGNTQHAGRIPEGIKSDVSIRMNIERLKQQLAKSIAAEEYENAAKLRDQIRGLSAQMETVEGGGRDA